NDIALRAVVTFSDPVTERFYLQDATGAMRIRSPSGVAVPQPGDEIVVRGKVRGEYIASIGMKSVELGELQIKKVGTRRIPDAERRTMASLFFDAAVGEFVRVETDGI